LRQVSPSMTGTVSEPPALSQPIPIVLSAAAVETADAGVDPADVPEDIVEIEPVASDADAESAAGIEPTVDGRSADKSSADSSNSTDAADAGPTSVVAEPQRTTHLIDLSVQVFVARRGGANG